MCVKFKQGVNYENSLVQVKIEIHDFIFTIDSLDFDR